jgi:hypothetical protein
MSMVLSVVCMSDDMIVGAGEWYLCGIGLLGGIIL